MKLSDFCAPFYSSTKSKCGIKGKTSQPAIAEFFVGTALGDFAKIELVFSDDLFRKWFKGEREPKAELWAKVAEVYDETRFSRAVSSKLNEEILSDLLVAFGIELEENGVADKFAFSAALTKQFGAIARGNGEADDIVKEIYVQYLKVKDFPDYVTKSQDKYSKLKTLLYSSEERLFKEFFVCNTISKVPGRYHRLRDDMKIEDVTLEKLEKTSMFTMLVGMGGIGKSMMMRHLFLTSIDKYAQTGKLPILVTLREFGLDNNDLFNVIVDSVHRFDITFSAAHVHKLMTEGKCQLLLDGLDEIKASDMDVFQRQLDALIDRYPKNQYVMSTRKFSSFVELSRFTVLFIMPFNNEQALELIDRLEYCPEEPKLKQQFRERLVSDYFKSHAEFVTNPLLLTLMLMSYHRFADVPEKKYLFYEQAYQTLLQRHDSDKLAYKRVFHSVKDPSDFTLVFREFCAKSYRKGDYEFSHNKFDEYFSKLKMLARMDPDMMKLDNFLFDVCHSACLMYEEGQNYHFLHRSFQEYFFADYYSRQDDTTLMKLGSYIDTADQILFDEGSAFDMLYDLAQDKVERFIIMPFLASIYDNEGDEDKYWLFLTKGYDFWIYQIYREDLIEDARAKYNIHERHGMIRYENSPSSVILSLVLKVIGADLQFKTEKPGTDLMYDDLICERLYGELLKGGGGSGNTVIMPFMRVPEELINDPERFKDSKLAERLVLDADGKPVEFGYIYAFNYELAITEPDKYSAMKIFWEKETCPARNIYNRVAKYYQMLKEKYEHVNEMDDDNF